VSGNPVETTKATTTTQVASTTILPGIIIGIAVVQTKSVSNPTLLVVVVVLDVENNP